MSEFMKDIAPAVFAGLLGGLGAFTAVKVDIAVLKEGQDSLKQEVAIVQTISEKVIEQEANGKFLQYQVDKLREDIEEGKFVLNRK